MALSQALQDEIRRIKASSPDPLRAALACRQSLLPAGGTNEGDGEGGESNADDSKAVERRWISRLVRFYEQAERKCWIRSTVRFSGEQDQIGPNEEVRPSCSS